MPKFQIAIRARQNDKRFVPYEENGVEWYCNSESELEKKLSELLRIHGGNTLMAYENHDFLIEAILNSYSNTGGGNPITPPDNGDGTSDNPDPDYDNGNGNGVDPTP
jgi:hypothetical protein